MSAEKYAEDVAEEIRTIMGEGYSIGNISVKKENGLVLQAITIEKNNSNCPMVPNIYIDSYFLKNLQPRDAAKKVICLYDERRLSDSDTEECNIFINDIFYDFAKVKERIYLTLLNKQKNHSLLQEIPHVDFLDLAIVFRCFVSEKDGVQATFMITNGQMNMWKVSVEDIFRAAKENTLTLFPPTLNDAGSIHFQKDMLINFLDNGDKLTEFMYAYSNENKLRGAGVICYDEILEKIAERMDSDIVILPSSIHEVLLLPRAEYLQLEELNEMVCAVNGAECEPDEVLSDHIYIYSREKNEIYIP